MDNSRQPRSARGSWRFFVVCVKSSVRTVTGILGPLLVVLRILVLFIEDRFPAMTQSVHVASWIIPVVFGSILFFFSMWRSAYRLYESAIDAGARREMKAALADFVSEAQTIRLLLNDDNRSRERDYAAEVKALILRIAMYLRAHNWPQYAVKTEGITLRNRLLLGQADDGTRAWKWAEAVEEDLEEIMQELPD